MISILLVFALCMSLSLYAFAEYTTGGGITSPRGSEGSLNVDISLNVNRSMATAKTNVAKVENTKVSTSVMFYYKQGTLDVTTSARGVYVATAGDTSGTGTKAISQHSVIGGTYWGNWSGSLIAKATN